MGVRSRRKKRRVSRRVSVPKEVPTTATCTVALSKGPTDSELRRIGDEFWDLGPGGMDHQSSSFGSSPGGGRWW